MEQGTLPDNEIMLYEFIYLIITFDSSGRVRPSCCVLAAADDVAPQRAGQPTLQVP